MDKHPPSSTAPRVAPRVAPLAERRVAMPLEPVPEGLVARAMDRITVEAAAGRARSVASPALAAQARPPAWLRLARGQVLSPRALKLAGTLAVTIALVAALGSTWLTMGALARGEWLLDLRSMGLEARLAVRALASPYLPALAMGAAALACALLATLDTGPRAEPAPLRPIS